MNKSCALLAASVVAITVSLFSGCAKPVAPPPAPQTGTSAEQHRCAASCLNTRSSCLKQQNKIYQQCAINARKDARLNYDAYVTEQLNAKKKVELSPESFLNLTNCRAQLKCAHSYSKCLRSCGL